MYDRFKENLDRARQCLSSAVDPTNARAVLAALREVVDAHERRIAALRLLLAVVELAGQDGGVEEDHYQAAIVAARRAVANAPRAWQEPE